MKKVNYEMIESSFYRTFSFLSIISFLFLLGCEKKPTNNATPNPGSPVYPVLDDVPAWSPDGSTIAYHHFHYTKIDSATGGSLCDYDSSGIWFINPDGFNKRMFLKGSDDPDWSPDGQWLAFVQGSQIYKIKVTGDSLTQLTFEGNNFFPDWSPDGEKIVYDSNVGSSVGGYSIWIMNDDGSHKTDLGYGRCADWAPDGKELTYVGLGGEIYRVDLIGNKFIQLTFFNSYTDPRCPAFSPDGSKIVFGCAASNSGLWVMNADGRNHMLLATDWCNSHSWSSDGIKIVYNSCRGEYSPTNGTLWIMNADGTDKQPLTFGPVGGAR